MSGADSKLQESMRKIASTAANQVESRSTVGLGSGSAVAGFAKALSSRISSGKLETISIIPSSMQAWMLAKENSLPLHVDSAHCPENIDIAVDGADQVASISRAMIKGGGGALLREKVILNSAKKSFILIDSSKIAEKLSRSVPIEVLPFALQAVSESMKKDWNAQPMLRRLEKGYPFFTESGNVIIDVQMKEPIENPKVMEGALKLIPGVLEVGIFNSEVKKFYVALPDGSTSSI